METELWKVVSGHPKYKISNLGRVWSSYRNKIMTPQLNAGYYTVLLDRKKYRIHRLVANAFCIKPINGVVVHHINENKKDNRASNLEWTTVAKNTSYSRTIGLYSKGKVCQIDKQGVIIAIYDSVMDAARKVGVDHSNLSSCLKGRLKTTGGFGWKYLNTPINIDQEPEGKVYKDYLNYIITPKGQIYSKTTKNYLKVTKKLSGHIQVHLCKNGKYKHFYVHRLVAELFIPNENSQYCVNHKNGNASDNRVINLEWTTQKNNALHSCRVLKNNTKQVIQYSKNGEYIDQYDSVQISSEKTGIDHRNIASVARGEMPTTGGFVWIYI